MLMQWAIETILDLLFLLPDPIWLRISCWLNQSLMPIRTRFLPGDPRFPFGGFLPIVNNILQKLSRFEKMNGLCDPDCKLDNNWTKLSRFKIFDVVHFLDWKVDNILLKLSRYDSWVIDNIFLKFCYSGLNLCI